MGDFDAVFSLSGLLETLIATFLAYSRRVKRVRGDGKALFLAHLVNERIEAAKPKVGKAVAMFAMEPVPMLAGMHYIIALGPVFATVENE